MWLLPSALWLMAGCSVIDDDLSNCPADEAQYQMEYELKLVTNMTTELQTQLTTITEISVANALKTHLENIFSDFAHDVNLSFYDTEQPRNDWNTGLTLSTPTRPPTTSPCPCVNTCIWQWPT